MLVSFSKPLYMRGESFLQAELFDPQNGLRIYAANKIKMLHLRCLNAIKFILQIFLLLRLDDFFHFLALYGLLNNREFRNGLFFFLEQVFKETSVTQVP